MSIFALLLLNNGTFNFEDGKQHAGIQSRSLQSCICCLKSTSTSLSIGWNAAEQPISSSSSNA